MRLIEKVREVSTQDERVQAALLYGSFAYGEGDPYSDLDVYLFFDEEALSEIEPRQWLRQIAPIEFHYRNEFGIDRAGALSKLLREIPAKRCFIRRC